MMMMCSVSAVNHMHKMICWRINLNYYSMCTNDVKMVPILHPKQPICNAVIVK